MAGLDSGMAGLGLKECTAAQRPKRTSVVSQAVSVEAEKELELNIADDVTQVPGCPIVQLCAQVSGVWVSYKSFVGFKEGRFWFALFLCSCNVAVLDFSRFGLRRTGVSLLCFVAVLILLGS